MIEKINQIQIGSYIKMYGSTWVPKAVGRSLRVDRDEIANVLESPERYSPIPLTEEILKSIGFKTISNNSILNSYLIDIDRDRYLSISNPGEPNEMLWIETITEKKVTDLVCLWNYDYDEKLFLHNLQYILNFFEITFKINDKLLY